MQLMSLLSSMQFLTYRLSTIFNSFKTLYTLSPSQVEAFLNSYVIYNHDWANEKEMIKAFGTQYQEEIHKKLIDYYSVLNHLCSIGQVEKMYIPPVMDLQSNIITNQKLFEIMLCADLGLAPGHKILDIGCGRGRVANHMTVLSGAHVVGMNIDPNQLETAKKFAASCHLSHCSEFIQGDINNIPYPFSDGSFDHIYEIQCLFSLSKDLGKVFKEVYRLLKPGGRFGALDWVSLNKYNPKNPHHQNLIRKIKPLIGAIGTYSVDQCSHLLQEAGFKILRNQNASIDGFQAPLIENADKFFTRVNRMIHFFVRYKILPPHFQTLFDRLTQDGDAFIEADRLGLVTSSYYFLVEKP